MSFGEEECERNGAGVARERELREWDACEVHFCGCMLASDGIELTRER